MENVFAGLTSYGEKWSVVATRAFNATEIGAVNSNSVVSSNYGKSVCFFMKGGKTHYIPLSNRGKQFNLGESIDMAKAKLVTLEKSGEGTIVRVEVDE